MIRINYNELVLHLNNKLNMCYLLNGNELLILKESQDLIRKVASKNKFNEHYTIDLENNRNWDNIFDICQDISLFSQRKTLLLIFPESGLNSIIIKNLIKLYTLLHKDILLILRSFNLNKKQENSIWFKTFSSKTIYVICNTPKKIQLPFWVSNRAKLMKLQLDNGVNQLLCYYYEGNLLELAQILKILLLIYPDGIITLLRIKKIINDSSYFMPYHWLESILVGNGKRSIFILKKLQKENIEIIILLRILQYDLLLLLTFKRCMTSVSLYILFNKYKIWKSRQNLIIIALQRLSYKRLYKAIQKLTKIEINLKKNYNQLVWLELEKLSIFLCDIILPI